MKVFNHVPPHESLPDLFAETIDGKRHYTTPTGAVYPSITTVLSVLHPEVLDRWRERVGEEQADQISKHAADRGTDFHVVLESYLKNEPLVFPEDKKSLVKIMFKRMQRILDARVDNIVAQEIALFSDALSIAGRCDCIGEYNKVLSIIDFKGTTKAKKKDWITGYFIQATAYSLMYEERTGIKIDQIVILMGGETDFTCQVFVEQREQFIEPLHHVINKFNQDSL